MIGEAYFSDCKQYRYWLTRSWGGDGPVACSKNPLVVIGLNPSTADASHDDPTIRREIGFAKLWGHDGLVKLNLFAFRATDPRELALPGDKIGPNNDNTIWNVCVGASQLATDQRFVLCAWGNHAWRGGRGAIVTEMLKKDGVKLHCLGLTKQGQPKHTLYLKADTKPVVYA